MELWQVSQELDLNNLSTTHSDTLSPQDKEKPHPRTVVELEVFQTTLPSDFMVYYCYNINYYYSECPWKKSLTLVELEVFQTTLPSDFIVYYFL